MSQLAARDGQPGNWEEPDFFLRRPETVRFRAESWQEPYESRGSRTDLRGTGGEIPPVYPTMHIYLWLISFCALNIRSKIHWDFEICLVHDTIPILEFGAG